MITIEKLSEGRGRLLAAGFYGVCGVFLLSPSLDVMGAIVPIRFDNIQWRFGMVISLAPTIMVQAVALGATAVFAVLWGHKNVLRAISILAITLAALYAIMALMFAIDILQLRGAIPDGRRDPFYVMVGKCLTQSLVGGTSLAVLGMGAWRLTRTKVADPKKEVERAARAVLTKKA
ncbi:MAG: hypothetical protein HYX65_09630 [Gemmatimonadetes bacterium]|nr:hypothetical protein [Gemmatimonadota bacterium]